jgi:RNA polymerase sigma factor (sigma-70 family)
MSNLVDIPQLVANLFRQNAGKITAVLTKYYGLHHIDTIMDVIQDSFEVAIIKWNDSGVPQNPEAWLMQVAKNKASNAIKRAAKTIELTNHSNSQIVNEEEVADNQLKLLFTCCQPSFSHKNQIIITLHLLCGFGVPEIANALLMNNEAVKKAISRCKAELKNKGNILDTNFMALSKERTETVQLIIYLLFNEGYKTTRASNAINRELCFEAIRLAKLLLQQSSILITETYAILALQFFTIARFDARISESNEWISLEEQDRSLWNKAFIEEGYYYLNKATDANTVTRYHIEAIIASLHCSAKSYADTNWERIAALYSQLETLEPQSLFVTLSKIIAESNFKNADAIMKDLHEMDKNDLIKENFLFLSTKANVYKKMGDINNAIIFYEKAILNAQSVFDKNFLNKKINELKN